jgi:histidinol-phosphate aminotransferase
MSAYPVPDARFLIKLDAMENPFGLPPALREPLNERLAKVGLNRYPVPSYRELKELLRRTYNIPKDCDIILGNGSDELIDLLAKAAPTHTGCVLAPAPGFVMYAASAIQARVRYVGVPLLADFGLDMPAMREAIEKYQPTVIYMAYPNNPTGNCFGVEQIQELIELAPGIVVIDEAYQPFAGDTWMQRFSQYEHVLVMRTVSKWGLAGIRLGYMAGRTKWINELEKLRPPYNINVLTEATALYCLENEPHFARQSEQILIERGVLMSALLAMPGVTPFPSKTNFVLARFADAAAVHKALLSHKILVKNVSAMHPLLSNCLRLTVGTPSENKMLIQALSLICGAKYTIK